MSVEYYIIHDLATGQIMQVGDGRPGIAAMQRPGAGKAALRVSEETRYALADAAPESQALALSGVRAALWDRVKERREALIDGGLAVDGIGTFDSTPRSRENIHGAVTGALLAAMAEQAFAVTWTLADNSTVDLDGPGMIAAGQALLAHVDACHAHARVLREAVEDPEAGLGDILQIDVTAGWPGEE